MMNIMLADHSVRSKDLDEIQICRNTVIYELPYIIYLQYKRLHAPK